jgi:hypothetical protein
MSAILNADRLAVQIDEDGRHLAAFLVTIGHGDTTEGEAWQYINRLTVAQRHEEAEQARQSGVRYWQR